VDSRGGQMAVGGDSWWPSAGIFVAAGVEILVATDR
jgi:hypothetical protein